MGLTGLTLIRPLHYKIEGDGHDGPRDVDISRHQHVPVTLVRDTVRTAPSEEMPTTFSTPADSAQAI